MHYIFDVFVGGGVLHVLPFHHLDLLSYYCVEIDLISFIYNLYACMLGRFSHVQLFATIWTVVCQAPLSKGFSREEYWSGLPCPPPVNLPDPRTEPESLVSPALEDQLFTTSAPREALKVAENTSIVKIKIFKLTV